VPVAVIVYGEAHRLARLERWVVEKLAGALGIGFHADGDSCETICPQIDRRPFDPGVDACGSETQSLARLDKIGYVVISLPAVHSVGEVPLHYRPGIGAHRRQDYPCEPGRQKRQENAASKGLAGNDAMTHRVCSRTSHIKPGKLKCPRESKGPVNRA